MRLLAGAVLSAALATGVLASTASASTLPVVQAHPSGWSGMVTRPGAIHVGNGGSPFVRHLMWSSWGASSAHGSGQLVQQDSGCTMPSFLCPVSKRPATVYLHDVRHHNGKAFFKKMRWNWTSRNGHARVAYWLFGFEGGSVPAWMPR